MARRVLFGVIIVVLLVAAKFLFIRPVPVELELDFGATSANVRAASLVFTDAHDRIARDLDLEYPTGAPTHESRQVRLQPGDYTVGVRLTLDGGPGRMLNRPLHVAEPGRYSVTLY